VAWSLWLWHRWMQIRNWGENNNLRVCLWASRGPFVSLLRNTWLSRRNTRLNTMKYPEITVHTMEHQLHLILILLDTVSNRMKKRSSRSWNQEKAYLFSRQESKRWGKLVSTRVNLQIYHLTNRNCTILNLRRILPINDYFIHLKIYSLA